MAVTGAAVASRTEGGHRVTNYIKAHWKELLALVLAAIPALFIIFTLTGRKAAQQTITLAPNGSAPSGADVGSTIPSADNGSGAGPLPKLPGKGVGTKQLAATAAAVKANVPPFPGTFVQQLKKLRFNPTGNPGPPDTRRSVNGGTGRSATPPPRLPITQTTMAKPGRR